MANDTVIADSLQAIEHVTAFDLLWKQRLSAIQADAVLVYIIDSVSAEALPFLAKQFDVDGEKGYSLATNDAERRAIIKQAIELKRYMGTVWAVKEAIRSVGYAGAVLDEGIDQGTPAIDWAKFRVEVDLGNSGGLNSNTAAELTRLINYYKNVRSHLLDISYITSVSDTLPPLDDIFNIGFENAPVTSSLQWIGRFADGTYLANGSITAVEGNDSMQFTIQ